MLSAYSTSIQGELLVSTFTGAMHRRDALRAHILPVIFEWHVGHEVNGIGAQQGALDPIKFLISWQRGESTTADVLSPDWDFWAVADRDLEELRWRYGIPPLLPADAAVGAGIVIGDEADPYANQWASGFTPYPRAGWSRSRRHRWTAHAPVGDSCRTAPGVPASPPREPRRLRTRWWTAGGPSC